MYCKVHICSVLHIDMIVSWQAFSSLAALRDGRLATVSGDNTICVWYLGHGICVSDVNTDKGVRKSGVHHMFSAYYTTYC